MNKVFICFKEQDLDKVKLIKEEYTLNNFDVRLVKFNKDDSSCKLDELITHIKENEHLVIILSHNSDEFSWINDYDFSTLIQKRIIGICYLSNNLDETPINMLDFKVKEIQPFSKVNYFVSKKMIIMLFIIISFILTLTSFYFARDSYIKKSKIQKQTELVKYLNKNVLNGPQINNNAIIIYPFHFFFNIVELILDKDKIECNSDKGKIYENILQPNIYLTPITNLDKYNDLHYFKLNVSVDSTLFKDSILNIDQLVQFIKFLEPLERNRILSLPGTWRLLQPYKWEYWLFFALINLVALLMSFFYYLKIQNPFNRFGEPYLSNLDQNVIGLNILHCGRHLINSKQNTTLGLAMRDFGTLSYDSATHCDRAEVAEYRGFLHWNRDASEKLLSILLILCFFGFIVRLIRYLIFFINGEMWQFSLLSIEINVILSIIGLGLIIDGLVLVAAMSDAPGISKTLDSLIVVLAGVVILLVEARPGNYSFVQFTLGENPWIAIGLACMIAILFVVRWIVRHHTVSEWIGSDSE